MATKDLFFLVHTTSVLLFCNRKTFNIHTEPYKHSNTMQSKVVGNSTLEGLASSMAHKLC